MRTLPLELINKAFEIAVAQYVRANAPAPSQHARPPRPFWPGEISVSTLAWVQTSCQDQMTRYCAIGVGAQHDRPATVSMQEGTLAHASLLPVAENVLAQEGIAVSVEHRFTYHGLRGIMDMFIPDVCVVELKTSNASAGRSAAPSPYEMYQVSLYSWATGLPVVIVIAYLDNKMVTTHPVNMNELARFQNDVLATLQGYVEMAVQRPTPPVGQCGLCTYRQECGVSSLKGGSVTLCSKCQRPLSPETVVMISEDVGLHICGQGVKKSKSGLVNAKVSGGKIVRA